MIPNENLTSDGDQTGPDSTSDVEEMLQLLRDTEGKICAATDPESDQRIKFRVRNLIEGVAKLP